MEAHCWRTPTEPDQTLVKPPNDIKQETLWCRADREIQSSNKWNNEFRSACLDPTRSEETKPRARDHVCGLQDDANMQEKLRKLPQAMKQFKMHHDGPVTTSKSRSALGKVASLANTAMRHNRPGFKLCRDAGRRSLQPDSREVHGKPRPSVSVEKKDGAHHHQAVFQSSRQAKNPLHHAKRQETTHLPITSITSIALPPFRCMQRSYHSRDETADIGTRNSRHSMPQCKTTTTTSHESLQRDTSRNRCHQYQNETFPANSAHLRVNNPTTKKTWENG